jgi:5-methylcytosine-specific restriction enzyme subunit McrC
VDGPALLIVDTKWKVPRGLPSDGDLKQMFVYNELIGNTHSVLLYPSTDDSMPLRGTYTRREHGCEQRYLRLFDDHGRSLDTARGQIDELLRSFMRGDG